MPFTRREALIRAAGGPCALALRNTGTGSRRNRPTVRFRQAPSGSSLQSMLVQSGSYRSGDARVHFRGADRRRPWLLLLASAIRHAPRSRHRASV